MNSLIFSVTQLTLSFSTNLYNNAFIPQKIMISNSKKINTPKNECRKLLFILYRQITRLSTDSKFARSSAPIGIESKTLQNPRKLKIRSIFIKSQYVKMSHLTLKNLIFKKNFLLIHYYFELFFYYLKRAITQITSMYLKTLPWLK